MLIHEILKSESPYLLKLICKQFNLDEKSLKPSPGDFVDYYDFAKEMQTDAEGQSLNYARGKK